MIDSTSDPPNDSSEPLFRIACLLIVILLLAAACTATPPVSPVDASEPAVHVEAGATASNAPTEASPKPAPDADEAPEADAEAPTQPEAPEADAEAPAQPEAPEDPENAGPSVLETVYDDAAVGREQTPLIEAELGLVRDEALNAYVRSVALRLLRYAPRRPFDWEFKIVDQSVPNAFALPGGKIYVSRGLLALATSEDELANVLGHEITHAAERHAAARQEYSRRINPFLIGFPRMARIAAYGRDQERDADRGGQMLAQKAGYDPRGIATFLRKLDAAERYEIGWSRLPSFFATHPTSPERAAIATDRAGSLTWERGPGVAGTTSEDYYKRVDGLILGDDPAGGVFDPENRFIHPEMRFSVRFPPGWETMNSQQAVRAVSPRRDAQAELTVVGDDRHPLGRVVDDFLEREFEGLRLRVYDRREIRVGELPAVRVEGTVASEPGRLAVSMTFVVYEGLVYQMTVLALPGAAERYRGRTRVFSQSFRPLDEAAVRSLMVTRLRVARALEGETLQALSERTRNALEPIFTGVLNGIYASTPLAHRTPIKIGIAEPYLPLPRKAPENETTGDAPGQAPSEGPRESP
jgi:predicted Zn-dependent protease